MTTMTEAPVEETPTRPKKVTNWRAYVGPIVGALLLLYLTVFPLVWLLVGSFQEQTGPPPYPWTLDNYAAMYGTSSVYSTFVSSIVFAVGSSALAFAIATALAWLVERTDVRFRRAALPIVIAPLVLPG